MPSACSPFSRRMTGARPASAHPRRCERSTQSRSEPSYASHSAARAKNYRAAQTQATALRELAGRANTELMRLGLNQCVLRASGMPL